MAGPVDPRLISGHHLSSPRRGKSQARTLQDQRLRGAVRAADPVKLRMRNVLFLFPRFFGTERSMLEGTGWQSRDREACIQAQALQ